MLPPKKTILITGIKGFLGSNIANLLKDEYDVYGIGKIEEENNGIKTYSSLNINEIPINPDFLIICHAAVSSGAINLSNDLLFQANVDLTQQICNKFSRVKIIYISTASIYKNDGSTPISENSEINPQSDYAISKLWAENIILKNSNSLIVRLASLYGNGMRENTIIPNYVNQALKNELIEVWGKGERLQNYIHVNDTSAMIKTIIEKYEAIKIKILLCVSNKEYSNDNLAQIIASKTSSTINYINTDNSKSVYYDNSLTRKELGWNGEIDLKNGIENYIEWKQKQF